MRRPLLRLLAAALGLDQRMSPRSVRAIGGIEPFFGEREEVTFVGAACGTAGQFDRLCRVVAIIVFFGHGRRNEAQSATGRKRSGRSPALIA